MRVYYAKTTGALAKLDEGPTKYVLWGDWLEVEEEQPPTAHYIVNWQVRSSTGETVKTQRCRVKKTDTRRKALLEMIFLDVGQGDGCVLNVPDGATQRTVIVDAGVSTNTYNFLKWRFRNLGASGAFEAAVITHPDKDHYNGFQRIFDDARVTFTAVYHNGLVERVVANEAKDLLGARQNGQCTEIYVTHAALKAFLTPAAVRGSKLYPNLLWTALSNPARFGTVQMAAVGAGTIVANRTYLPGFEPQPERASIEILGPVPEPGPNGAPALRELGDAPRDGKFATDKTKNGHSVILKLEYGGFRVLFGGDLNLPAEDYLLRHYGEISDQAKLSTALPKASKRLGADILKCCHHGSADVTDEFVEAVSPLGVVVSSGDQESHVHPRPEVLGMLGKKSRSERPILLCTELLRSAPERLTLTPEEKKKHRALLDEIAAAPDASAFNKARRKVEDFWEDKLRRLVAVYGAINVRTDGDKLVIAFRKEARKGNPWHAYAYEIGADGWVLLAEHKPGH